MNTTKNTSNIMMELKRRSTTRVPTLQQEKEREQKRRTLARTEAATKGRKVASERRKTLARKEAQKRKAAAAKEKKPARGSAPADVVGANTNKVEVSSILTPQQKSLSTTSVVPQSLSTSNAPSEEEIVAKGATSVCWALKCEAEEQAKRKAEEQANAGGAIGWAFINQRSRFEAMKGAERDAEVRAVADGVNARADTRGKARRDAKREAEREDLKQFIAGGPTLRASIKQKARKEAEEQVRHEANEQVNREDEEKVNSAFVIGRALMNAKARREGEKQARQESQMTLSDEDTQDEAIDNCERIASSSSTAETVSLSSTSVISLSSSSFTLGNGSDTSEESTEGASTVFPVLAEKAQAGASNTCERKASLFGWRKPKRELATTSMPLLPVKGKRPRLEQLGHHRPPLCPRRERSEEPTENALAAQIRRMNQKNQKRAARKKKGKKMSKKGGSGLIRL